MDKTFDMDHVTSDQHFRHDNIVRYCNRPQNHDEIMDREWRDAVDAGDRVYHLGDFGFLKQEEMETLVRSLPGYKVLILGNHDKHSESWYLEAGFDEVHKKKIILVRGNATVVLSHYPLDFASLMGQRQPRTTRVINIHGHIHNNGYDPKLGLSAEQVAKHYRNVSVEMTDYRPMKLDDAIAAAPRPRGRMGDD